MHVHTQTEYTCTYTHSQPHINTGKNSHSCKLILFLSLVDLDEGLIVRNIQIQIQIQFPCYELYTQIHCESLWQLGLGTHCIPSLPLDLSLPNCRYLGTIGPVELCHPQLLELKPINVPWIPPLIVFRCPIVLQFSYLDPLATQLPCTQRHTCKYVQQQVQQLRPQTPRHPSISCWWCGPCRTSSCQSADHFVLSSVQH